MSDIPSVVVVHGAFADASSYSPVVPGLLNDGTQVLAPPCPTVASPVTRCTSPPSSGRPAVSQRPLAVAAFGEPANAAAWRDLPAWGIVAAYDRAINPEVQRFGYERAQVKSTEVDSSHLVMHAHPDEVVRVIREALASVSS